MDQILELLKLAGYKPEDESDFLQVTRGMSWLISTIPDFTPTPVQFAKTVTAKM